MRLVLFLFELHRRAERLWLHVQLAYARFRCWELRRRVERLQAKKKRIEEHLQ